MKHKSLIVLLVGLSLLLFAPTARALDNCGALGIVISANPNPIIDEVSKDVHFTILDNSNYLNPNVGYKLYVYQAVTVGRYTGTTSIVNGVGEINYTIHGLYTNLNNRPMTYRMRLIGYNNEEICQSDYRLQRVRKFEEGTDCNNVSYSPVPADITTPISITYGQLKPNTKYRIYSKSLKSAVRVVSSSSGSLTADFDSIPKSGISEFNIFEGEGLTKICTIKINIFENAASAPIDGEAVPFSVCNGVDNPKCAECLTNNGVWTALGCIKTDPKAFIGDFLKIAIGIAGGIALLLMVYGAFLVSVSAGDPKKATEGKEMITGTIAGLLFIIFSVFLLRLIGVNILNIPGF